MGIENYKTVLYRQQSGGWVAEIPAVSGCYALMDTREEGKPLPTDITDIVSA